MKLRDIAKHDSRFFLKSEYGPLSESWPAMSFSLAHLKVWLNRHYRPGLDFIVYTATGGPETPEREHRSRLLSVLKIDLTRTYPTEKLVSKDSWEWAKKHYPGQWEWSFGVIEGWTIDSLPLASDIVPHSYSKIGKYPHRGMVLELESGEREALLDLSISPVRLPKPSAMQDALTLDALRKDPDRNAEAVRIADLIFNRVTASGTVQQHTAPIRTAPSDLVLRVAEMLKETPLVCGLCGGLMLIRPANRLLQPSPDRVDSSVGSYGPENFHLTHLACNLAKSSATVGQFEEWLAAIKAASSHDPD
jgi:hypothetical protein